MLEQVIYKYKLRAGEVKTLSLPYDAKILHFAHQGSDGLHMWVQHTNTEAYSAQMVDRTFKVIGTGWPFNPYELQHVASAVAGEFVWHLMESVE